MRRIALRVTLAVLVAGLATACASHTPGGKDRPGVVLTYRIDAPPGERPDPSAPKVFADILKTRLKVLGESGKVTFDAPRRLVHVRLDRAHLDPIERDILGKQPRLEFFDLEPALNAPSVDEQGQVVAFRSLRGLLARAHLNKVPSNAVVVTCTRSTAVFCPGDPDGTPPTGRTDYYLLKHGTFPGDRDGPFPNMTGADVDPTSIVQDVDPATGAPIVLMRFTRSGSQRFLRVTRREADRGRLAGTEQHFAVVLNGQIRMAPAIDYRQNPHGIDASTTGIQITNVGSVREARKFVLLLQGSSLPGTLVLLSERKA